MVPGRKFCNKILMTNINLSPLQTTLRVIINNGHAPSQHLHIANLHQTCLGLVWRFAQDEPSCDGDTPANNFKLPYTNNWCLPTFVFNFSFKMMLLEMISNWFGVCWNSSCHKVSQTACILLWDAVSDGQVVHHCPGLWRWTASTLSTPLSSESVNLLTAVYNTLHSLKIFIFLRE